MAGITNGNGNTLVEAEGLYDPVSNTLVARKVHFEDSGFENQQVANGTTSAINAELGTFTLTVRESSGFSGTAPGTLNVQMLPGAEYRGTNGVSLSKTEFFAAMQIAPTGSRFEVKGIYREGILYAIRAKFN
jgi:hypothetical protein